MESKRAIVNIGAASIDFHNLKPINKNIKILGASSDHLILNIEDNDYKLGDIVEFRLDASLLKGI